MQEKKKPPQSVVRFIKMVRPAGLEPTTSRFVAGRSIQLS